MEPDKATRIYICLNELVKHAENTASADDQIKKIVESERFKETKIWLEGKK